MDTINAIGGYSIIIKTLEADLLEKYNSVKSDLDQIKEKINQLNEDV
jgi:hypothetical protein